MCRSTLAQWNYREKFNNSSENVRFPNTIIYSSNVCTLLSKVISFLSTANFDCPRRLNHFQEERFRKLEEKCTVTVVKCEIFSLWCLWGGPNMFNFKDYSAWHTVSYCILTHPTLKIWNTCPIVYSCQMTTDRSSCETKGWLSMTKCNKWISGEWLL